MNKYLTQFRNSYFYDVKYHIPCYNTKSKEQWSNSLFIDYKNDYDNNTIAIYKPSYLNNQINESLTPTKYLNHLQVNVNDERNINNNDERNNNVNIGAEINDVIDNVIEIMEDNEYVFRDKKLLKDDLYELLYRYSN